MISSAFAQAATTPAAAPNALANLGQFAPMVLIFLVFYLLLIRPQQKQQKQHRQMIADAKRGDEITTNGGIFGTVTEVANDHVMLEVAKNVVIKLDKSCIQSIKGYGVEKAKAA